MPSTSQASRVSRDENQCSSITIHEPETDVEKSIRRQLLAKFPGTATINITEDKLRPHRDNFELTHQNGQPTRIFRSQEILVRMLKEILNNTTGKSKFGGKFKIAIGRKPQYIDRVRNERQMKELNARPKVSTAAPRSSAPLSTTNSAQKVVHLPTTNIDMLAMLRHQSKLNLDNSRFKKWREAGESPLVLDGNEKKRIIDLSRMLCHRHPLHSKLYLVLLEFLRDIPPNNRDEFTCLTGKVENKEMSVDEARRKVVDLIQKREYGHAESDNSTYKERIASLNGKKKHFMSASDRSAYRTHTRIETARMYGVTDDNREEREWDFKTATHNEKMRAYESMRLRKMRREDAKKKFAKVWKKVEKLPPLAEERAIVNLRAVFDGALSGPHETPLDRLEALNRMESPSEKERSEWDNVREDARRNKKMVPSGLPTADPKVYPVIANRTGIAPKATFESFDDDEDEGQDDIEFDNYIMELDDEMQREKMSMDKNHSVSTTVESAMEKQIDPRIEESIESPKERMDDKEEKDHRVLPTKEDDGEKETSEGLEDDARVEQITIDEETGDFETIDDPEPIGETGEDVGIPPTPTPINIQDPDQNPAIDVKLTVAQSAISVALAQVIAPIPMVPDDTLDHAQQPPATVSYSVSASKLLEITLDDYTPGKEEEAAEKVVAEPPNPVAAVSPVELISTPPIEEEDELIIVDDDEIEMIEKEKEEREAMETKQEMLETIDEDGEGDTIPYVEGAATSKGTDSPIDFSSMVEKADKTEKKLKKRVKNPLNRRKKKSPSVASSHTSEDDIFAASALISLSQGSSPSESPLLSPNLTRSLSTSSNSPPHRIMASSGSTHSNTTPAQPSPLVTTPCFTTAKNVSPITTVVTATVSGPSQTESPQLSPSRLPGVGYFDSLSVKVFDPLKPLQVPSSIPSAPLLITPSEPLLSIQSSTAAVDVAPGRSASPPPTTSPMSSETAATADTTSLRMEYKAPP
ncbi:hypothetical protein PFISCL1PPCAC_24276, partial [Pristionchus fissidentatus]